MNKSKSRTGAKSRFSFMGSFANDLTKKDANNQRSKTPSNTVIEQRQEPENLFTITHLTD